MDEIDVSRFDEMLDITDPNFAEKFRQAIGARPGEVIEIITPQCNRTDGRVVTYIPDTPEEYAALPLLPPAVLRKIGCGVWDDEGGKTHWLFPAEWYGHIPAGTPVLCISGETESFEPGVTDDDRRVGCLAYGFIQEYPIPEGSDR